MVPVFHFEGVQEPFHRDLYAAEHRRTVGGADGEKDAPPECLARLHQRLFEYITAGPEDLTTVDQDLGLGAVGHEIYRAGQDKPVGGQQLGIQPGDVVLYGTFAMKVTLIALGTGCEYAVGQWNFFDLVLVVASVPGNCFTQSTDRRIQKKIGVPLATGAGSDRYYMYHSGQFLIYERILNTPCFCRYPY